MTIPTPTTHAVIFDFGNVVAFFDYQRACDRLATHTPGRTGADLLAQARASGLNPLVLQYETGRIDDHAFCSQALDLLNLSHLLHPNDFADAWRDIFTLNQPVARIIAELDNAGTTLLLGSNTNPLHARQFLPQFAEVFAHFDHLVLSFEIGHAKPSPAFFETCVKLAKQPPHLCLFIDDLPENIRAAHALGLDTLLYQSPEHLNHALHARKILKTQPTTPTR